MLTALLGWLEWTESNILNIGLILHGRFIKLNVLPVLVFTILSPCHKPDLFALFS